MADKSNKPKKNPASEKEKGGWKNAKKLKFHPRSSEMVLEAIASIKKTKGLSMHTIKKYITATYRVDIAQLSSHINKYIKSAVEKKEIVQMSGNGTCGIKFRMPTMAELQAEKQKNMPKKKRPRKKQEPVKSSRAAKNDARKKDSGKPKRRGGKKGGKPNGQRFAAS